MGPLYFLEPPLWSILTEYFHGKLETIHVRVFLKYHPYLFHWYSHVINLLVGRQDQASTAKFSSFNLFTVNAEHVQIHASMKYKYLWKRAHYAKRWLNSFAISDCTNMAYCTHSHELYFCPYMKCNQLLFQNVI